jgi:hypothetical protein
MGSGMFLMISMMILMIFFILKALWEETGDDVFFPVETYKDLNVWAVILILCQNDLFVFVYDEVAELHEVLFVLQHDVELVNVPFDESGSLAVLFFHDDLAQLVVNREKRGFADPVDEVIE